MRLDKVVAVALYREGKTLAEIGAQYGVSRERVRQVIARAGLTAEDGGQSARAKKRLLERVAQSESRCFERFGCNRQQLRCIPLEARSAYSRQKDNAARRGIAWKFTLWSWWLWWAATGKWDERGRGQGYCMGRYGDTGAYSIDNVYLTTCSGNMEHFWLRKSPDERTKAVEPMQAARWGRRKPLTLDSLAPKKSPVGTR